MSAFSRIVGRCALAVAAVVMTAPAWAIGPSTTLVTTPFGPPAIEYLFADPGEAVPNIPAILAPTYIGGDSQTAPGPVTITSENGQLNHAGSLGHNYGTAFTSTGFSGNQIFANVSPGYGGVGFYVGSLGGATTSLNIDVYTSAGGFDTYTNVSIPQAIFSFGTFSTDKYGFIGFTSSNLITKVIFSQNAPTGAEDFVMGSVVVTAVPEPSLPMMLVVGLGLIGMVMRRKSA